MRPIGILKALSFCLLILQPLTAFGGPSFTALGALPGVTPFPGGDFLSTVNDVSGDGSTVVGDGSTESGNVGFRWTAITGVEILPGTFSGRGVSFDGSVVVGRMQGSGPFRWTSGTGAVELTGGGTASDVSADGSVVVGFGDTQNPWRWTAGSGFVFLGDLPGGSSWGQAYAVSADGSVVVGSGTGFAGTFTEGFRWTQVGGMTSIGLGPAWGISADGLTIVGRGHYRWTVGTGQQFFGGSGNVLDVSADGSLVVGQETSGTMPNVEAFIHSSLESGGSLQGLHSIKLLLENNGLPLTGWELIGAWGISDDGSVIVGQARNPDGFREGYIITGFDPQSIAGPITMATWTGGYGLSGADADPLADGDGDGMELLLEFAFRRNPQISDFQILPTMAGESGMPLVTTVGVGSAAHLRVEYVRRTNAPELSYTVQFGNDLTDSPPGGWVDFTGTEDVTAVNPFWERVVVEDAINVGGQAKRFGRVVVSYNPTP